MIKHARVVSVDELANATTVVVPVIFDEEGALVAEAIPGTLVGRAVPHNLEVGWSSSRGLNATPGSALAWSDLEGPTLLFVSLGASYNHAENFRLAGACAAQRAVGEHVVFLLPTDGIELPQDAAQALVEGALLASYDFKKPDEDRDFNVLALGVPLPSVADHDDVVEGVRRGVVVANEVNWAKRLIDSPPNELTPKELAKRIAQRLGADNSVQVEIWTESKIRDERLGGLLGVGSGSAEPSRLVYAIYQPPVANAHVALVGKGITFDSGGLSIKSGEGMMTMKTDMSGAAVVMAALSIAARLELPVRVTAIAPITENLSGDRATRPGDVLTIRNGKTIEVLNTDAEGRLVLADGLSLAVEANPDAIIDVATLTGAQAVALGDEVGGLFASTDELAELLSDAGDRSGEMLWRLPLVDRYEKHIESDIADMKNIGKPGRAGAISAALILQRFTDGRPWAHLDIAGPGRADATRGYVTKGATAFGTRTLVEFLAHAASSVDEFSSNEDETIDDLESGDD
ncbi:MAG: leucyl aminopeptidase [Acidimicrobiaceae bacterium]|nr:leucyl aminopeptidase [Acidimicrobiaceae bacterium]